MDSVTAYIIEDGYSAQNEFAQQFRVVLIK